MSDIHPSQSRHLLFGNPDPMSDQKPLNVYWFYDMNALRNPAGVTRHALAMRNELEKYPDQIQLGLCTGRIHDPDILAVWQQWDNLPRCEFPLSTRNLIRYWRLFSWPPATLWTGKTDWIYCPAEFYVSKGKSRLAVTSHDIMQDLKWQPPRRKQLLDQLYSHVDLVFSISRFNTDALLEAYPILKGRVVQISNAADELFFEPASEQERNQVRAKLGLPAQMPYLLSVANFQPRKNLAHLIRAVSQIPEAISGDLALVLVGEGSPEEYENLKKVITETGKPKLQIRMAGYIQGTDLRSAYAEAVALVFPSLCESFGIPAVEAMTQGCPVAVSDTTCLPEIVSEAGWYFKPESVDSITESVNSIIHNRDMTLEKVHIGQIIASQYRWKNVASSVMNALQTA